MTSVSRRVRQWIDPRRGPYTLPALVVGAIIAVIIGGTSLLTDREERERVTHVLNKRSMAVDALHREIANVALPDAQETSLWKAHETQVQQKLLPDIDSPLLLRSIASLVEELNNPNIAILNEVQANPLLSMPTTPGYAAKGNDQSLMITIRFQSGYSEVIRLLERVAQQKRFMKVETLHMTRTPPHITVEVVLKALVIPGTTGMPPLTKA